MDILFESVMEVYIACLSKTTQPKPPAHQGTGRIAALRFRLQVNDHEVFFTLPVEWRRFQCVLEK
jgi:hypothetical protein